MWKVMILNQPIKRLYCHRQQFSNQGFFKEKGEQNKPDQMTDLFFRRYLGTGKNNH